MSDTVRVGLVGAGWIAEQHLSVIDDAPNIVACGLTSRTCSRAKELSSCHGGVPVYDSLTELVEVSKPDAIMVVVSAISMYKVAIEALDYGLPVFLEKPAGLTPAENADLLAKAEAAGIKTMVGYNRRYYSVMQRGLEIVLERGPLLGVFIEGHERFWKIESADKWSSNVKDEWIYANSVHTIDLLRFFGGEARAVQSIAHSFVEHNGDQFSAVMELECGAIGQYSAHWWSPGGWRAVLYGDGVTAEFSPLEIGQWTDKTFQIHDIEPATYDLTHKPGFYGQIEAFARFVRTGQIEAPAQDLAGALATMRLAEAIACRGDS